MLYYCIMKKRISFKKWLLQVMQSEDNIKKLSKQALNILHSSYKKMMKLR